MYANVRECTRSFKGMPMYANVRAKKGHALVVRNVRAV